MIVVYAMHKCTGRKHIALRCHKSERSSADMAAQHSQVAGTRRHWDQPADCRASESVWLVPGTEGEH